MPNPYFQFKQFIIRQDKTAMKVCTDACLFGAWVANYYAHADRLINVQHILDIGTGTGLLSLMLAQKLKAKINAIEIDEGAAAQALENVQASQWAMQVSVVAADVKQYDFEHSYDLIISNPPFYENDLKSGNVAKDQAMHDTGLTMEILIRIVKKNLTASGYFTVLIPAHRREYLLAEAGKNQLQLQHELFVRPTPRHSPTRVILLFQNAAVGKMDNRAVMGGNNCDALLL